MKRLKIINPMTNICYIIHGLDSGGMEKHLLTLCKNLDPKLFQIHLIYLKKGKLFSSFQEQNVKITQAPYSPLFRIGWIHYMLWLRKELLKYRIDILHIYIGWTHITEVIVGKFTGVKKIITTRRGHVSELDHARILLRQLSNLFVDLIIGNSKFILNWAKEIEKYHKRKTLLIYNGVEIKKTSYPQRKNNGKIKVVYIASLTTHKRHIDLLEAVKIIISSYNNIEFWFVGDGALRDEIEEYIIKNKIEDFVKLLGYRDDVQEILYESDISINCSETECNSNAILESMANGVPVIATDIEGNKEIIINNVSGVLVQVKSPDDLARSIVSLIKDFDKRLRLVKNAYKIVKRYYSIENMISKYSKVYLDI